LEAFIQGIVQIISVPIYLLYRKWKYPYI